MTTSIITSNINALQYNELRDFMQNLIEESMKALDSHDAEHLMWYENCTMNDYFTMWTEIWNDDELVGEGLDTIAHKFVLNDDTQADFDNAFEEARDEAFKAVMSEIGEEIINAEGTMDDIEHEEDEEWNGEVEGYDRIGSDEELQTEFFGYHDMYNTILGIVGAPPMTVDQFAIWAGATAAWRSNEGWPVIYYKKK